jgi:hippurate hydrolase
MLGAEKVGAEGFPLAGSEDFAEYLMIKPGAFFALGTKEQEKEPFCHSSHFDFNDRVIPLAMHFWLRLAQDRIQNT